jgi:Ion transport protein
LLLFIAVFLIDLNYTNQKLGLPSYLYIFGSITTKMVSYLLLLPFLIHEIYQIRLSNFSDYISSIWNVCDLSIHLIYPSYIILSYLSKDQLYATKCLQCCILILVFIKFLFFLRIFEPFSFLVQMFISVFRDMQNFIIFFSFVVIFFSIFLGILINDLSSYEGIGPAGYFVIALRQSLGDYDTSSFASNSDYDILTWLVWLVVMMVGNVIFMNFIIAVVGQSYENCMQ